MNKRATEAVPSGLRVKLSLPILKVYISLLTISEVNPKVRLKISVCSKMGSFIFSKPNRLETSMALLIIASCFKTSSGR